MERRRRRQRPFQRGGARPPWIGGGALLAHEGVDDADEEHQSAQAGDVGANRRDEIPTGERIRIIGEPAWHAGKTEEVLREEGYIDADEGQPEMQLADELRVHVA